jgi:hypothetical protein
MPFHQSSGRASSSAISVVSGSMSSYRTDDISVGQALASLEVPPVEEPEIE